MRRRLSMGDTCGEQVVSWGRTGQPEQASPWSHLPVNVLFDEAGALTDIKALQQCCGRGTSSITPGLLPAH